MGLGLPAVSAGARVGMDKAMANRWAATAPALKQTLSPNFAKQAWVNLDKTKTGELRKYGISEQKFIQDYGNFMQATGQLGGNFLYLAALQSLHVLQSENPKEAALDALFHFAPWAI